MRIISKFKDYYDGAAEYGIDQERVYVRESKLVHEPEIRSLDYNVIGFCGKLYAFESKLPNYYRNGSAINDDYDARKLTLYGDDLIDYYLKEEKIVEYFTQKTIYTKTLIDYNKPRSKWRRYYVPSREKHIEKIKKAENNKTLLDVFVKYKTPVFWYSGSLSKHDDIGNILLNPNLKLLGFFKVMDTVTAFQKIEQFISNELACEMQGTVPVGSDEILGKSKGFDNFSFRNINTKKMPKKF